MTVRLYDTKTQTVRDFAPRTPGEVSVYVCGPTVQSGPHIGHLRGALSFDILTRWLEHRFGRVVFVRNVTDIDDKVLENGTADEPWWALAQRVEREFADQFERIGIRRPTYEPRATGHIPQMITMIGELIDAGHAYAADGDVYFDVRSWPDYGALTHQSVDAMEAADDADPRGKRDPHDFALWKGAKPGEPDSAAWPSPWGPGRPGWHIECSAMARRYLGRAFDIHGGGLDLRFPHHENELAQSAALGDGFAGLWMHNGLVTVDGQKMSKSLGNFILARDLLGRRDPLVVRYALAAAHYRSSLDVSDKALDEAEAALGRIGSFLARAERIVGENDDARLAGDETAAAQGTLLSAHAAALEEAADARGRIPVAFAAAMDDDLSVPQALGVLHESVRAGNSALDAGATADAETAFHQVEAMVGVLGIDPRTAEAQGAGGAEASALDDLMAQLISWRAQARAEKDWTGADRIRDAIGAAGITVEDTPDGPHWSIDG